MPIRTIELTPELDQFISARVEEGFFKDASGMVRAALRILEREVLEYDSKMDAIQQAIDEGDASGIAEGDVFERIRANRKARQEPAVTIA